MANEGEAVIGLVGLGTMGANLALNIAEKGFRIAVWNRTTEVTRAFVQEAGALRDRVIGCETPEALLSTVAAPRAIILMVPAGAATQAQFDALMPRLQEGDFLVDTGNANFHDTARRVAAATEAGRDFLGVGVSGGEEGARHGPAIMGGGPRRAWDRIAPVMDAIAARHEGEPCAGWLGEGGAGHFVKMVHNGIEYADMQIIAEAYGIMRDGMGLEPAAIADVFARWNEGPLRSYLIEISASVAEARDPATGAPMLDVILDRAGQKGTGRWTSIEAQHLGTPITVIDAAVAARNLSARLESRREGQRLFGAAPRRLAGDALDLATLEQALVAGKIVCYDQGFAMLKAASDSFGWDLPLPQIARIWRAGCIIRSAMLNDMASALSDAPDRNLLFAPRFAAMLGDTHDALRRTCMHAAANGLPSPALGAALAYFDGLRTARSTANMIQGQRDFFGAHGFERIDAEGAHHGPWGGQPDNAPAD